MCPFNCPLYGQIFPFISLYLSLPTCGEHARVWVGRGQTHVLLDASSGAFGCPLDRQVLRLPDYSLPCAAMIMNSLRGTIQG